MVEISQNHNITSFIYIYTNNFHPRKFLEVLTRLLPNKFKINQQIFHQFSRNVVLLHLNKLNWQLWKDLNWFRVLWWLLKGLEFFLSEIWQFITLRFYLIMILQWSRFCILSVFTILKIIFNFEDIKLDYDNAQFKRNLCS